MSSKLKENPRGCRFEDVEEMKEAVSVTRTLGTSTLEVYGRAFKKCLEQYNKCVVVGRSYLDGGKNFRLI